MVGMFQTTADMIHFVGTRFPCSTLDEQKNCCRSCGQRITLGESAMTLLIITIIINDNVYGAILMTMVTAGVQTLLMITTF